MRKSFNYRGCTISPEVLDNSILVACNASVNRYLKTVWRVTFPDLTWARLGTKNQARRYVESKLHLHQAGATSEWRN